MSQPNSDFGFDSPDFAEAGDGSFEQQAPVTAAPAEPRYRKQGFSIYTMLLMLSFLCLVAGMIIMFVDADKYQ